MWSDGGYFSKPRSVAVSADQRAIIIKDGKEISMTFSTGYTGKGDDFAWIIPTPVPPEIADVSEAGENGETAFRMLEKYTAPVVTPPRPFMGKADTKSLIPEVTVYGKVMLEHYEVTILGATAASPLLGWLHSNGYEVKRAARRVLDAYIRQNWAFVAVKLNPGQRRRYANEFLPALTFKYRDERLVFPLRLSTVSTTKTAKITLYVIAESTVSSSNLVTAPLVLRESITLWAEPEAHLEDCIRESAGSDGRSVVVLWKGPYRAPDDLRKAIEGLMKKPFRPGSTPYLTRLELRARPAGMTEDIQLVADPKARSYSVDIQTTQALIATPQKVPGFSGAKAVEIGYFTTVLKQDGTVWAWDLNESGELGRGNSDPRRPVQVRGLAEIAAIADDWYSTLLLREDGTVWGAVNNVSYVYVVSDHWKTSPEQAPGLSGVVAIASGAALKAEGTVWLWYWDPLENRWITPKKVPGLSGVVAIAAGLAMKADGTVWVKWYWDPIEKRWGTPEKVPGLSGVVAITAGWPHAVALKRDGTVWAWGENRYGQLGDGSTLDRNTPVQVRGLSGVVAITAGLFHTVALKKDGTVWAWGANHNGQLGDGSTANSFVPVQVAALSGIVSIAAGDSRTAAIGAEGTVWGWGNWVNSR